MYTEIPPAPDDEHVYRVEQEWTCREHDQPIPGHWSPHWFEDCTCDRAEWKPTGRVILTLNMKGILRVIGEEYLDGVREEMRRKTSLLTLMSKGESDDA